MTWFEIVDSVSTIAGLVVPDTIRERITDRVKQVVGKSDAEQAWRKALGAEPQELFRLLNRKPFLDEMKQFTQGKYIRADRLLLLAKDLAPNLPEKNVRLSLREFTLLLKQSYIDLQPEQGAGAGKTIELLTQFIHDLDQLGVEEIRSLLLKGLNRASTQYAVRIENFLVEYLGTATQSVPFGGRDCVLRDLDAWLTDPQAPPYGFIAADAGRGKSAVLTRWVQSLIERDEAHVVFIPISIRFNTGLKSVVFSALAARLAELYEDASLGSDLTAEQLVGICSDYLRREPKNSKPVLVVLDGLDEAADWSAAPDLFPLAPPRGVRAVASARFLGGDADETRWLQRLGWESSRRARTFSLPLLDDSGVRDVLFKMGYPLKHLAPRDEIVTQLHRLSEGEPLLVKLYVEALLAKEDQVPRLKPKDLPCIEEGLKGYLDHWWTDQEKLWKAQGRDPVTERNDLLEFMNVCAVAHGPLSRNDIANVAGGNLAVGLQLDAVSKAAGRLVTGDGRKRGYVYSHPRLNQFFSDQMNEGEKASWRKRFLDYGKRTSAALNSGSLSPEEASAYVVQYYGVHLEEPGAPRGDLYDLICEGRLRAWTALEGGHSGFLNDVDRAWRGADADQEIGVQIRAALCHAGVAALSANYPAGLLSLAVRNEFLSPLQALAVARRVPYDHRRAGALSELAPILSGDLLADALAAAKEIQDADARARALTGLAPHLPDNLRADAVRDALVAAKEIQHTYARAHALTWLAPHLPENLRADAVRHALAAAKEIQDPFDLARALTELAPHLPENLLPDAVRDALAAAREIRDSDHRARALAGLAPHLPENLRADALAAAKEIQDQGARSRALTGLVPHLPENLRADTVRDALVAAKQIQDQDARASTLTGLASHLPENLLPDALAAAKKIRNEYSRANALIGLASHLPENLLPDALAAAKRIPDPYHRARALTGLAPHLPENLRADAVHHALAAAKEIQDQDDRSSALTRVAPHLPENLLPDALAAAKSIQDTYARASALTGLAPHLPDDLLPDAVRDALAAARDIQDQDGRSRGLTWLAPHLPESLQADAVRHALAAAKEIQDTDDRASALSGLASHLPGDLLADAVRDALAAAKEIEHSYPRASALTALAPHLPEDLRADAVRDALAAAKSIQDTYARASALTGLAPHLPDDLLPDAVRDALAAAKKIRNEYSRASALIGLASHLPENLQADAVRDALAAAREIRYPPARASALAGLAPHLPENLLPDAVRHALTVTEEIQDTHHRAYDLAELGPPSPREPPPGRPGRRKADPRPRRSCNCPGRAGTPSA